MRREGLVREPVTCLSHELSAEIGLGGESVMGSAAQREIMIAVLAALRESLEVMQLQVVRFAAALSGVIDVSTAPAVPLEQARRTAAGTWRPRRRCSCLFICELSSRGPSLA